MPASGCRKDHRLWLRFGFKKTPEKQSSRYCALLQAGAFLLVPNQAIEDGENLLPVGVHAMQRLTEGLLKVPRFQPFIQHRRRDVDVLPQGLDRVAAQEQAVEERCLALRS
jgi:hypothetical protein